MDVRGYLTPEQLQAIVKDGFEAAQVVWDGYGDAPPDLCPFDFDQARGLVGMSCVIFAEDQLARAARAMLNTLQERWIQLHVKRALQRRFGA